MQSRFPMPRLHLQRGAGATRLEDGMGPFPTLKSPTATLLMIDGLPLPDGRVVHPPLATMETIEREVAVLERTRLQERVAVIPSPGDDDYDPFLRGWDAAMGAVSDALDVSAPDPVGG